jgi:hypothetical protein
VATASVYVLKGGNGGGCAKDGAEYFVVKPSAVTLTSSASRFSMASPSPVFPRPLLHRPCGVGFLTLPEQLPLSVAQM